MSYPVTGRFLQSEEVLMPGLDVDGTYAGDPDYDSNRKSIGSYAWLAARVTWWLIAIYYVVRGLLKDILLLSAYLT